MNFMLKLEDNRFYMSARQARSREAQGETNKTTLEQSQMNDYKLSVTAATAAAAIKDSTFYLISSLCQDKAIKELINFPLLKQASDERNPQK